MIRWNATIKPQHTLPAAGVRASGTSFHGSEDRMNSKPAPGEAPTSA